MSLTEEQVREIIREEVRDLVNVDFGDKYIFEKDIKMMPNASFTFGKIEASAGLGLYGNTAPTQAGAIIDATAGATQDDEARTAINSLLAAIRAVGIIAT